jgi:hypothetical protein
LHGLGIVGRSNEEDGLVAGRCLLNCDRV